MKRKLKNVILDALLVAGGIAITTGVIGWIAKETVRQYHGKAKDKKG